MGKRLKRGTGFNPVEQEKDIWQKPLAKRREEEDGKLRELVARLYEESPFYRKKLTEAGIRPGDIRGREDLERIPFTEKEELAREYPFGLLAVPEERVVRVHGSSGTTGKRTLVYYTQRDLEDWADMMARCFRMAGLTEKDRIQITPGYGLWTAGVGFQAGVERLGAMAIPVGPAGTDLQLELMQDLGTTAFTSTSSYALLLGEEVEKRGLRDRLRLRVGIIGSEHWGERMRRKIEELLGIESFDIIGMTELYGPGIGLDCHEHEGIHYWSDHILLEVVDPETGRSLPPGETGELVATTLSREAMPLLRYRTRDLSRLLPGSCRCGATFPRIDRLKGRTDDMVKVRGVPVFPSQVAAALGKLPGLGSEYRLIVRREGARDLLLVQVEAEVGGRPDPEEVAHTLKSALSLQPRVEILPFGSLPRTERKTRRVFDERES